MAYGGGEASPASVGSMKSVKSIKHIMFLERKRTLRMETLMRKKSDYHERGASLRERSRLCLHPGGNPGAN
jgi:hypothetical protein